MVLIDINNINFYFEFTLNFDINSGNHSKIEAYQMTLKPFYYLHGENRLKNNIGHISENGCHFVVKEKLMYLKQM